MGQNFPEQEFGFFLDILCTCSYKTDSYPETEKVPRKPHYCIVQNFKVWFLYGQRTTRSYVTDSKFQEPKNSLEKLNKSRESLLHLKIW